MANNQSDLQRASAALAKGRVVEAEQLLAEILKAQPRNADAHNMRALAYMQHKEVEPALEHARQAVALSPNDHRFRGNLGSALMVHGQSEAARAELSRAIEISPDYVHARRNRGVLNLAMRRFADAVEDLRVVVRHAPDRADARLALADALIETGQVDNALEHMQAAESLAGQQTTTWKYMWGRLMFRSGRFRDAHRAFTAALLADPENMEYYMALAAAAYHCGELRESERITTACFQKFPSKERGPDAPEARILVLEPRQESYFCVLPRGPYPYDDTNFIAFMPCDRLSYTYAIYQDAESLAAALDLDRFDLVYNNCAVPELFELNGCAAQQDELSVVFSVEMVNPPLAVAQTSRAANAATFANAKNFVFPRTVRIDHGIDTRATMDRILGAMDLPVILRPLSTHVGAGAVLAEDAAALEREIAQQPFATFYAIEYHDCQSEDGMFRRYRLACIDGELSTNSMHVSRDWNVHGQDRSKLDWTGLGLDKEESIFYDELETLLGAPPEVVFAEIVEKTPLDIYGFDFGFRRVDGRIVVFEINAAMALSLDADLENFPYRKRYSDRFAAAAEAYLRKRMRKR